ncbi:MAG: DUF1778 domain-containing protein [Rhodospirillales bacterium]|jgi:uncharacterized protein (DUF1778 family)
MTEALVAHRRARVSAAERPQKRPHALKSEHMQIRVTQDLKLLVAEAAGILGTSISDFSTRVIRQAAEDEILNRRLFTLKSEDFDRFVAVIENPPELSKEATARLRRKPVWETA